MWEKVCRKNSYPKGQLHSEYSVPYPSLPPYKKQGDHRKSYAVIYENTKVMESTIKVDGNMQVIKRQYYSEIPCKSYTAP